MDNDPQIQYSYRWGNSTPTPWVDVPADGAEVEVHTGFFMRTRIKPQRCTAVLGLGDGPRVECERLVHDGPDQDPVHEGAIVTPDGHPSGPVMRWTDAVNRLYPTWDGRTPEGH